MVIQGHLEALYTFYGEFQGLRFARKHFGWYTEYFPHTTQPEAAALSRRFNKLETPAQQLAFVRDSLQESFGLLIEGEVRAA